MRGVMADAPVVVTENPFVGAILNVPVSAEDIARGEKFCFGTCPIANALMRLPGVVRVTVKSQIVQIQVDSQRPLRYEHTDSSGEFISRFDAGMPCDPGVVQLRRDTRRY